MKTEIGHTDHALIVLFVQQLLIELIRCAAVSASTQPFSAMISNV